MKRSLLLTIVVVLLLLGGAYWLNIQLFEEKPITPSPAVAVAPSTPSPAAPSPSASPPATDGGTVDGVDASDGGIAGGGATKLTVKARVASVRGKVETRNKEGDWTNLTAGQALSKDDSVRTGRSGEANLDVGNGVKVRLSPRSEFSIQELDEKLSRIRLAEGHVTASVDPNGNQVLKVEAEGSDAVAQSSGGTFGVISDGKGQVAVATTTGKVKFTSKGKSVDVLAGTETSVTSKTGPATPRPIPKSLLLKVAPKSVKTRLRSTYVEGATQPGNVVHVAGRKARVDARGRFRVKVALRDGPNRLGVEVTDASGRVRKKKLPPVIVDRTKPDINASMEWGGSDKKDDG